LVFAIAIRASAMWVLLALTVPLVLFVLYRWVGARSITLLPIKEAMKHISLWPISLVWVAYATMSFYYQSAVHPIYELDDFTPHHLRYHNAYMGLQNLPNFQEKYGAEHASLSGVPAHDDMVPFNATARYLRYRLGVSDTYFISPLSGTYRMGLHDQIIKKLYLKFAFQHPWDFVRVHFIKTGQMYDLWRGYLSRHVSGVTVLALAIFLAVGLCRYLSVSRGQQQAGFNKQLMIAATSILFLSMFSIVPVVYAYSSSVTSSDQFTMLTVLLVFGASLMLWRYFPLTRFSITEATTSAGADEPREGANERSSVAHVGLLIVLSLAVLWGAVFWIAVVFGKRYAVECKAWDAPGASVILVKQQTPGAKPWWLTDMEIYRGDVNVPSAQITAVAMKPKSGPGFHRIGRAFDVVEPGTYTISVKVKSPQYQYMFIELRSATAQKYYMSLFDLSGGTIVGGTSNKYSGIEKLEEGWYRLNLGGFIDTKNVIIEIGISDSTDLRAELKSSSVAYLADVTLYKGIQNQRGCR